MQLNFKSACDVFLWIKIMIKYTSYHRQWLNLYIEVREVIYYKYGIWNQNFSESMGIKLMKTIAELI